MAEIPPLDVSETSMAGADVALRACIARDAPPLDERPEVKAQAELLAAMSALARRIESHDPVLSNDAFRDANVYAARDAVRRLVDNATAWLRTLHATSSAEARNQLDDGPQDHESST